MYKAIISDYAVSLQSYELSLLIYSKLKNLCGKANGKVYIKPFEVDSINYCKIEFNQKGEFTLLTLDSTESKRDFVLKEEDLVKLLAYLSEAELMYSTFILQ